MTTVLSDRQSQAVIAAARTQRAAATAHTWLVIRLGVLVDGRHLPVRTAAGVALVEQLAREVDGTQKRPLDWSTHSRRCAVEVLAQIRRTIALGVDPRGWRIVLEHDDALNAAVHHLAANPHAVLIVAAAIVDAHALAARWS